MKNKNVGFLIVGIAVVIGIIVSIFNFGLRSIVSQSCGHGLECSMYGTISIQTWTSLAIAGLIFVIGLFLIFSKEHEKIVVKKIKEKVEVEKKAKPIDYSKLDKDEKEIIKILQQENGAIFQRTLMERLNIGKIKMTRLLDKLEAKQLAERKRRGMNNIVVLMGN